jgi:predicted hydrolase (HD superfamily)
MLISKDQALSLIREHVKNENIVKHMLALGAVMAALFDKLQPADGSTREQWYMAGLLHDGDYCDEVPHNQQGIQITKWAKEAGFDIPDNVAHAMAAHNWSNTGVEPKNQMDWSIFCADSLTGLIVACTLVLPTKKMADLKHESILKKFKQPSFASGTRREDIQMCETKLNIPLDQFTTIALTSMQSIASEIGL